MTYFLTSVQYKKITNKTERHLKLLNIQFNTVNTIHTEAYILNISYMLKLNKGGKKSYQKTKDNGQNNKNMDKKIQNTAYVYLHIRH